MSISSNQAHYDSLNPDATNNYNRMVILERKIAELTSSNHQGKYRIDILKIRRSALYPIQRNHRYIVLDSCYCDKLEEIEPALEQMFKTVVQHPSGYSESYLKALEYPVPEDLRYDLRINHEGEFMSTMFSRDLAIIDVRKSLEAKMEALCPEQKQSNEFNESDVD